MISLDTPPAMAPVSGVQDQFKTYSIPGFDLRLLVNCFPDYQGPPE